jgi:hypothetical protein
MIATRTANITKLPKKKEKEKEKENTAADFIKNPIINLLMVTKKIFYSSGERNQRQ